MNAAIRAVVRTAIMRGYSVKGIRHGYNGLLTGDIIDMNLRSVSEIIHRGGTILYTARCLEFKTLEGQQRAAQACRDNGIDALVVIGGDGSFRGCKDMAAHGNPLCGASGHHRQRYRLHRLHHWLRYRHEYRAGDDRQAARYHPEPRPLQCGRGHGPAMPGTSR